MNKDISVGILIIVLQLFLNLIPNIEILSDLFYSLSKSITQKHKLIDSLFKSAKDSTKEKNITEFDFKKIIFKDCLVTYDDKEIIKFPNFEIMKNEKIYIDGKNGAGKTSFVYAFLNLLSLKDGQIITNENLNTTSLKIVTISASNYDYKVEFDQLPKVGKIFSDYDSILYKMKKNDNYQLSVGERQKINLEYVTNKSGNIFIFDEPTTNLDILGINEFYDYINLTHKTIIVITHNTIESYKFDKKIKFEGV